MELGKDNDKGLLQTVNLISFAAAPIVIVIDLSNNYFTTTLILTVTFPAFAMT